MRSRRTASLRGVIVTSAKKSIFIAGADLQTLLRQAQTGEMRAFIAEGQQVFNRLAALKIPTVRRDPRRVRRWRLRNYAGLRLSRRLQRSGDEDRFARNDARSRPGLGRCDAVAAIDRSRKAPRK